MRETLERLWPRLRRDWRRISKVGTVAWLIFFGWFFLTFWTGRGFLMLFNNVDFVLHEAGHLLFSYTGSRFLAALGGSLFQLFVPAALCMQFVLQREPYGTAFCSFVFFQNFLHIGPYMADARAQLLPLVTVGGGEAQHDFYYLFGRLGLLPYDTMVGGSVGFLGWAGMLAAMVWLWGRYRKSPEPRCDSSPLH